ncbi:MAG: hypothetical protein LBS60_14460 [Deltaproteobacteria bacterium]|jgi:hypothetical protein|nr:hypothetical protein [Deltaproteobacteria bacterium]
MPPEPIENVPEPIKTVLEPIQNVLKPIQNVLKPIQTVPALEPDLTEPLPVPLEAVQVPEETKP